MLFLTLPTLHQIARLVPCLHSLFLYDRLPVILKEKKIFMMLQTESK